MHCAAVRKHLSRYVDSEVPPGLRAEIEEHLVGCANCRQAVAKLEGLAGMLRSSVVPEVPEGFAARVMRKAQADATEGARGWWFDWKAFGWWWESSAAMRAAAIGVVVVGLTAGAVMGGGFGRGGSLSVAQRPARGAGPVAQTMDFIGGIPAGSVEQAYLTWVTEGAQK